LSLCVACVELSRASSTSFGVSLSWSSTHQHMRMRMRLRASPLVSGRAPPPAPAAGPSARWSLPIHRWIYFAGAPRFGAASSSCPFHANDGKEKMPPKISITFSPFSTHFASLCLAFPPEKQVLYFCVAFRLLVVASHLPHAHVVQDRSSIHLFSRVLPSSTSTAAFPTNVRTLHHTGTHYMF
jgi:hypothetical protein